MELECLDMSGTAGEEHANLYIRGVNEGASAAEIDAQEILDVLDVFEEDGVRIYLVGFLEGIEDRQVEQIEEYEMLEASVAFVVHESSVFCPRRIGGHAAGLDRECAQRPEHGNRSSHRG